MERLINTLKKIDGRGYKAYKDIQGSYQGEGFTLHIDYVQGDPFASPSRIRVDYPIKRSNLDTELFNTRERKIAFEDFFAREASWRIHREGQNKSGSGKSGLILIDGPGQEVIDRASVRVNKEKIEFRLSIGLPARGRSVLGKQAITLLSNTIPAILNKTVFEYDHKQLIKHIHTNDQQNELRKFIKDNNYISFISNGAVLPRESGISNRPLRDKSLVPFTSPPSFEVKVALPHGKTVTGMAIPKGITLIVGGGYHGKSTLLKAIEKGVYNHIPGDGREFVITDPTAFKIRAEDGRSVEKVDISPFINNLPFGKDTKRFSSDDASGSTSQATNIIEALEMESKVLLIDEDTSATNFMIRDGRMQKFVGKDKEPITPFIDKARQLYNDYNVSTILVIGGSGDYFSVADNIIMLDEYKAIDVTKEAKEISEKYTHIRNIEGGVNFGSISHRIISNKSFNPSKGRKEKVDSKGLHTILYGMNTIDLSFVEQLVDQSQTRAIAMMINYIGKKIVDNKTPLYKIIENLYLDIAKYGLEVLSPYKGKHPGNLALPRKFEVAAAVNRLRQLKVL
jgi:predicted ABC-class ATPase